MQGSGSRVQGSGLPRALHPLRLRGFACFHVRIRILLRRGSGFRVQGSGFRVQGSGFRVWGLGFRVWGSGFRLQGSEFGPQSLGCAGALLHSRECLSLALSHFLPRSCSLSFSFSLSLSLYVSPSVGVSICLSLSLSLSLLFGVEATGQLLRPDTQHGHTITLPCPRGSAPHCRLSVTLSLSLHPSLSFSLSLSLSRFLSLSLSEPKRTRARAGEHEDTALAVRQHRGGHRPQGVHGCAA